MLKVGNDPNIWLTRDGLVLNVQSYLLPETLMQLIEAGANVNHLDEKGKSLASHYPDHVEFLVCKGLHLRLLSVEQLQKVDVARMMTPFLFFSLKHNKFNLPQGVTKEISKYI